MSSSKLIPNNKFSSYSNYSFYRSKNEKTQQKSMHSFYEKARLKNKRKIKICVTFLRIIYPMFNIVFIAIFWMVGLVNYFKDN